MAVVTLATGVPEEDVVTKKMARDVTGTWQFQRKKWLVNKLAREVTTEGLRKTWFENKMARLRYVLVGRRSAKRADW